MQIKELWTIDNPSEEHYSEAQVLNTMKLEFEKAIEKAIERAINGRVYELKRTNKI